MTRPDADARPRTVPIEPGHGRPDGPAILEADSLFRGRRELVIAHAGQHYRLRITQNGKLILTK